MSKYYEAGKPFSQEKWNELIRDVQDKLLHPRGSCQTVARLEEVEGEHLWSVRDVEKVREAISDTCPDILWQEELKLWDEKVLDEIERNMEQMWCNCDNEDEEIHLATIAKTRVNALPSEGGGLQYSPAVGGLCGFTSYHRVTWHGTYYPIPTGDKNTIDQCSANALKQTRAYITNVNELLSLSAKVREYQALLDQAAQKVEFYETLKELHCHDDPESGRCQEYDEYISRYDSEADLYQYLVDRYLEDFKTIYPQMQSNLSQANQNAAESLNASASVQGRFPCDENIIANYLMAAVAGLNWGDWFDPNVRLSIGLPIHYDLGYGASVQTTPVWPTLSFKIGNSVGRFRVSPNGTPYFSSSQTSSCIAKAAVTTYSGDHEWLCNQWSGKTCLDGTPACSWGPAETVELLWSQSYSVFGGSIGWLIDYATNDEAIRKALDEPPYEYYLNITQKPPEYKQNHAARQQAFWDSYLNWYDEHPQYERRGDGSNGSGE